MGGVNKNNFFDYAEGGHYRSAYHYGYGYVLKAGIDGIKTDKLRWRFTLGYERYSGELHVGDGGLGGGHITKASIEKSVISAGVFPLNFTIFKRIDLNAGVEYSALLQENFSGTFHVWSIISPGTARDLHELYTDYSAKSCIGVIGRIAYNINISDKLILSPQYSFYYGLSEEFREFPRETRSLRHQFGVAFCTRRKK